MTIPEPTDSDIQPDDPGQESAGWDAFWAETLRARAAAEGRQPTEVIRGVEVRVPQDLPLSFEMRAKRLRSSDSDEAFAELLSHLFGADVLDTWVDAGMGGDELRVVLAWGLSHGRGKPITFREAYELVSAEDDEEEDEDGGAGKASRRTSGGSASSGRSSKPTSRANTSSRRKR